LSFQDKLRNYARVILIHGLGIKQKARPLYIEVYQLEDHGGLIPIIAEEAYRLGVKTVDIRCRYPMFERAMFRHAPEGHKTYEPEWITARAKEIVKRDGAYLALHGNGDLGIMDDVDSNLPGALQSVRRKARGPLTKRHMSMLQPWCLVDVPTEAWAKKLGMSIDELWEFLFHITGADLDDPVGYALEVNESLKRRTELLNELRIRTLHFVGDGTDLKVGLSSRARWQGGSKKDEEGVWFEPNWPSFEVYTTPDWRKTEGKVRMTMPVSVSGPVVSGLHVSFKGGRATYFSTWEGADTFKALISTDKGAAQLGEIALVGLDSPLSKYSKPHFCGLLDENKRCHLAFGSAYASALKGGPTASKKELAELGCNTSDVHQDMMISDESTSIFALDAKGKQIAQIMKGGHWVGELL
jgi:aminopeptidase